MLKNMLSLLLSKFYSKQESELVANQAMPSNKSLSLNPTKTEVQTADGSLEVILSYTAPANGFLVVRGIAVDVNPRILISSSVEIAYNSYGTNVTTTTTIPVAKGLSATVRVNKLKEIQIRFQKCIGEITGGGLSLIQLLRRRLLCLNSLYNFLRRSSLSARKNGLANNLLEENFSLLSQLRRTVNTIISLCRVRAMQFCVGTELLILTLTESRSSTEVRQQTLTSLGRCTQEKVRLLLTLFGLLPVSLTQTYESTKRKVADNSLVGGAL